MTEYLNTQQEQPLGCSFSVVDPSVDFGFWMAAPSSTLWFDPDMSDREVEIANRLKDYLEAVSRIAMTLPGQPEGRVFLSFDVERYDSGNQESYVSSQYKTFELQFRLRDGESPLAEIESQLGKWSDGLKTLAKELRRLRTSASPEELDELFPQLTPDNFDASQR